MGMKLRRGTWNLGMRVESWAKGKWGMCCRSLPSAHPRYTERDLTMCESSCSYTGNVRPCVFTSTTRSTGK